jgi:hypothetical protein
MAKYIMLFLLLLMVGGVAFLGLTRVPAPTQSVEKTIPNSTFFAQ